MLNSEFQTSRRGLSATLLRWSLLATLVAGVIMGALLSIQAAKQTQDSIQLEGQQLVQMFAQAASFALAQEDGAVGKRTVAALFEHQAMHVVRLQNTAGEVLEQSIRPLQGGAWRGLGDAVFGLEHEFQQSLYNEQGQPLGQLLLVLDSAPYATAFAARIYSLLGIGLLCGLALLVVFHLVNQVLLTRPLGRLLEDIQRIDPERPGRYQLSVEPRHKHNELGRWVTRVNLLLGAIEHNIDMRRAAEQNLQRMSHVDFLTGLPNRAGLQVKLDRILEQAAADNAQVAVLCLGLDGFKLINEQHSFQQGDWVLRQFAQRIGKQLKEDVSCFARLGGDQFILVQSGANSPYQATVLAQKVLLLLQQPFVLNQPGSGDEVLVQLGATIGITLYPRDAESSELLLQKAEQALQLAKLSARNKYQFYMASADSELRLRRELEEGLRVAVEQQQLLLMYQPQVCYSTGQVVGAEALLRWQHPVHGWIPPDRFIPIAEQSGSIQLLGEWVLDQVCQQLQRWQAQGLGQLRVAVNLSAVQLHHGAMEQVVARLLERYTVPPANLELEVTETSLVQDIDTAQQHLLALRQLGVGISIDDFGTGYSSLVYLKRLPLDKIKIDRSFVQDVLDNGEDATIVRAVIQLGHNLGLRVLAEGVETAEQQALLIEWGCDEGQGYLYSRPVEADALTELLRQGSLACPLNKE